MSHAVAEAAQRIAGLAEGRDRIIVGIIGAPGVGKSTFAGLLVDKFGDGAIGVGMDGFHLANSELARLGRREAKGAIDTFDGFGFLNLIRRLASAEEEVVYVPEFRRDLDESVAGAIPVPRETPVIIVEGNYLLAQTGPWQHVREHLTECWYLETEEHLRLARLQARHESFGDTAEDARGKARGNDQRNAELVEQGRAAADLIINVG